MEHGSIIARMCYETFSPSGEKEHVTIGKLIYFRNHKGGCPTCQFRWDVVPGVAWKKDPDVYFIGNFTESEKVSEPPYLCGKMFVTTNQKGDHVEVGHINTRQRDHNGETQYYMQLFGVPMGELVRQQRKAMRFAIETALRTDEINEEGSSIDTILSNIDNLFDARAKSLFVTIEMD